MIFRPSWILRSARLWLSAWASVLATMKSTPWTSDWIMLAMALPPAPPTPITLIRGRSSSTSGRMKSMLMRCLPYALAHMRRAPSKLLLHDAILRCEQKVNAHSCFPHISSILSPKCRNQALQPCCRTAFRRCPRRRETDAQVELVRRRELGEAGRASRKPGRYAPRAGPACSAGRSAPRGRARPARNRRSPFSSAPPPVSTTWRPNGPAKPSCLQRRPRSGR